MRGSRKKYQSTVGVVNVWGGKIKVAGEIIAFAGGSIPSGFLIANGALVNRVSYANLFAAIGGTYGVGDGVTTFALPDLRGEFIRGTDNGRGVDSARVNGSAQSDLLKAHTHDVVTGQGSVGNTPANSGSNLGSYTVPVAALPTGGNETRPRNIAMQYLIQY